MNPIENELKAALARREPPDGFARRVMARVPPPRKPSRLHSWSHSRLHLGRLAAAAAIVVAILGGVLHQQHRSEQTRIEGERARAELVFALEVASEKLQHAKAKVLKNSEDQL
jgi:hypothetical protein